MRRVLTALLTVAIATALAGCGDHQLGNGLNPAQPAITMNPSQPAITMNATYQPVPVPGVYSYALTGVISNMPAGTKVVLSTDIANLVFTGDKSITPGNTITITPDAVNGIYGAVATSNSLPSGNHYIKAKPTFGNFSATFHLNTL